MQVATHERHDKPHSYAHRFASLVALSALIGEIKRETSLWIKHSGVAPQFRGWGREYYAFSLSKDGKDSVIEYIKNQLEHHKFVSFEDEMTRMCNNMGAEFYET